MPRWLVSMGFAWLLPCVSFGQTAVLVVDGSSEESARTWQRRAEASVESPIALRAWLRENEPVGAVSAERLEVLSLIETLLVRARHASSRLEERDAVSILLRAESLAEAHLDVPGIAAWYAEVQLTLAVTATQAGLGELGQAALRRSASVDPTRVIQAAEARPDVVERGRAAIQQARTGARGRFEVRADPVGAMVFVDDRPFGRTPRTVELTVGPHLLVVDAPGHRRYAQLVEVLEGERPLVEVTLSPTPARQGLIELETSAAEGDLEGVAAALASPSLASLEVLLVFPGDDRALFVRCSAGGCDDPSRVSGPDLEVVGTAGSLASGFEWLDRPDELPPVVAAAWWEHWGFWTAATAVVGFIITAVVLAAQPRGLPPFVLTVDPGPLPTSEVD